MAVYTDHDGERKYLPQYFKFVAANPLSVRTKVMLILYKAFAFCFGHGSLLSQRGLCHLCDFQVRTVKVINLLIFFIIFIFHFCNFLRFLNLPLAPFSNRTAHFLKLAQKTTLKHICLWMKYVLSQRHHGQQQLFKLNMTINQLIPWKSRFCFFFIISPFQVCSIQDAFSI